MVCLLPQVVHAQGLTGDLIGTVMDIEGGLIAGARITLSSSALIGGPRTQKTNERGQLLFPALPPGVYVLEVAHPGFTPARDADVVIAAGATIERTFRLAPAGVATSVIVEGAGSRIEARHPGFGTRFGPEDLRTFPTPRNSMFDFIRFAPGVSPTSPVSRSVTTVSIFGSGTNENMFLIDGTNFTCPCNGIARSEPGIDFIHEIQIQSAGASAEYGNVQGGVINVVTRQGSDRFLHDAAYYGQPAGLTSQPVRLPYSVDQEISGYHRERYRDFTTTFGGPGRRDRLWFFVGYQYLRDFDSQPGADPLFPRKYEQNKLAAKATWRLAPNWQLVQTVHHEYWVNPEAPTRVKPFSTTQRRHATVPAVTFGHLTHASSPSTLWEVRVGRFVHARVDDPSTDEPLPPNHSDRLTGVSSGGPAQLGTLTLTRTTVKATLNYYQSDWWGLDHQWKIGSQVERGEGHGTGYIPTGLRYIDRGGEPFQIVSSDPSLTGGLSITGAAFVSDAITLGDRLTVNAGLRFDHSRAISEDLHALDAGQRETDRMVRGLGTLYTWNILSPRLGVTLKLTADGRTMLRGSYGRFSQGVLTGEFSGFHPGVTPVTTSAFDPATGGYTRVVRVVDSKTNLVLDRHTRAPRTDEYSIGVDRELGSRVAVAAAYVHKRGANFIGWTDVGGQYAERTAILSDGRRVPVFDLVNSTADQRFLLTNADGYSLTYHGLVMVVEKRRAHGWQAFGSYTYSRAEGLQASSGTTAGGAQSSTVALPTVPIGRDPNDLTNAYGRLPNDRPHVLRLMGALDVPRTGVIFAANLQHFSGKPWAATALIPVTQSDVRVLLEPRGSRRLSSQTILDLRLSRAIPAGRAARVEILLDVLNALNDAAEEDLATDDLFAANFGQPTVFVDPRRVMIGVRITLGR
jgi:hypothetical protein